MLVKLRKLYSDFSFVFPLLIAFLLPFGINYGIIIALWLISFFAFGDVRRAVKQVMANKWSYPFFAFTCLRPFLTSPKAKKLINHSAMIIP